MMKLQIYFLTNCKEKMKKNIMKTENFNKKNIMKRTFGMN